VLLVFGTSGFVFRLGLEFWKMLQLRAMAVPLTPWLAFQRWIVLRVHCPVPLADAAAEHARRRLRARHLPLSVYDSILVPSTSRNFRIHSGCPGQAAAVTRLPSTTALENVSFTSHHTAPERTRSGLTAG
jgi:hypothetical protein